jgi:aryl-alcohol dehydrogenase-like predicted oxidoreductase
VARIILGCGNFGGVGSAPAFFGQGTPRTTAFALLDAAWELGITALDTADAYGGGRSETWIGEWLAGKGAAVRERVAITTKTFHPTAADDPGGLARARIVGKLDESLARLGIERVAVYMAHEPDPKVAHEETLGAFAELARAGKLGAIGASNFSAVQLQASIDVARAQGLPRYEVVQSSYSLLERNDRDTMIPLCRAHGIAYSAFSPLAGGWLTGKYRRGASWPSGSRMTQRPEGYTHLDDARTYDGLARLETIAHDHGVDMPALALAWLLAQADVASIVIGPNRVEQLASVRQALDLRIENADRLAAIFSTS